MNNILTLVKIKLKGDYNVNKQINSKSKNPKRSKIGLAILFGYLIIYAFIYIFVMAKTIVLGLKAINTPYIMPAMFMVLSSCFIILTDIFRVNGNLFKTKDFDLLNSLPIKKSDIILSKLITIYIENMAVVSIIMIPAFIVYLIYVEVSISFIIFFLLTLPLIPIIPMIIATFVGTVITTLASYFNKKNLMNFIFFFIVMIVAFMFSYSTSDMNETQLANYGTMLVSRFNNIYPLTGTYLNIIKDSNILSLFIFILVPSGLLYLYLLFMKKYYVIINSKLNGTYTKSNYKLKELKSRTPFKALFIKDVKRFYGSYLYVLNSCMGAIFLTVGCICLVIFGGEQINAFFESDQVMNLIKNATPLLIGAFCLLNSTTQASISIEGKSFKLLKSLPVDPNTIFISKIATNFTIFIPMIFINVTIIAIFLKFSIGNYILSLFIPLLYALFIALLGLITNLLFPNFDWDNEVSVIKQGFPSYITIFSGMLLAILPLGLLMTFKNVNFSLVTLLVSIGLIIIDGVMIYYLRTKGVKKFNELQ